MATDGTESGFTIIEVIITLVVLSLFCTMFFQMFLTATLSQDLIVNRASADDIATTNLKKITGRASTLLSGITCDTSLSGNTNNLTINTAAVGSTITFTAEPRTGTTLPSTTVQKMVALFPRGCNPPSSVPIEIVSTVTFGTETVTHAAYID